MREGSDIVSNSESLESDSKSANIQYKDSFFFSSIFIAHFKRKSWR